jgi:hypothetical protein
MAIGIICLLTFWLVYPYKVITINKIEVLTPKVTAGDLVEVYIESVKHMNVPATIIREIINDHAWLLPSFVSNVPIIENGKESSWVLRFRIPENAPSASNYKIHTTYIYQVNPIRQVRVEWMTEPFTVIAR